MHRVYANEAEKLVVFSLLVQAGCSEAVKHTCRVPHAKRGSSAKTVVVIVLDLVQVKDEMCTNKAKEKITSPPFLLAASGSPQL